MKAFITTILLLVSACALGADQPDDGIYLRLQDDFSPWIMSQDGQKLLLGARQNLKVQKSELSSQNNANTRFHLYVTVPYDENIEPSSYILIVYGTAYRQSGSGSSQNETSSLSFYISEEENAKQVSDYMKIPLGYRRHPRHNLLVSFTPTKQEFSVGDEVTATLRINNVGTNSVSFMKGGRSRAARDNQYVFSARHNGKQVNDVGTSYHFGGLASQRVLKPGEVFEDKISLSKWFAFDKAGMYEIHGSYYLEFNDPDADSWKTIWEDYISADFTVTIEDKNNTSKKLDAGDDK